MPNPLISQITLSTGNTYDIKDAQARADIETIKAAVSGGVSFLGATTTELTDGATTSPIIVDGKEMTPINGALVMSGDEEFVWADVDSKWHRLGPAGTFKALAYKDSASGTFTPTGSVSAPTFTGDASNVTITAADNTSGNYQPKGTVSQPTFTGTAFNSTGSFTPEGSVTVSTKTTTDKTATVSAAATGTDNNLDITNQLTRQETVDSKTGKTIVNYIYEISSVTAAHTIAVTAGGITQTIFIKQNDTWRSYSKVYKKVNGNWTLLSDLTSAFQSGVNYVRGGT